MTVGFDENGAWREACFTRTGAFLDRDHLETAHVIVRELRTEDLPGLIGQPQVLSPCRAAALRRSLGGLAPRAPRE